MIKVVTLFLLLCHFTPNCRAAENGNTFDFIIAGGGTAGLVVARRLSEYGKYSVLVVESGNVAKEGMDIPALAPTFLGDRDLTFNYDSIPQKNVGLGNNGIMSVFCGRVLSGTSNINYMFFNRGSPLDFDNLGNLTRDPTWNYASMLKYFKKAETYHGDFPSDQHGTSGPLTISRPKYAPGLSAWLNAGRSLGFPIADPNGPQKISFTPAEFTKRRGRRVSSFMGYINPILSATPNLQIILNTNVTQVLIGGNRATGVFFKSASPQVIKMFPTGCVFASKEVIVSAGAYGSPQLLLRSGIGPAADLFKANIPVVKDLPVGQNYQNHLAVNLPFIINNPNMIMDEDRDLNPKSLEVYERTGDGPYSNTRGTTGQAFFASSIAISEGEGHWPDIQLILDSSKQAFNGMGSVINTTLNSWEGGIVCQVFLGRPKSKGTLSLDPSNPDGPPILDVGYLSNEIDMEKILDGISMLIKLFEESPVYQKLGGRLPQLNVDGCKDFTYRSREFWKCYIRFMAFAGCHPSATCPMGWGKEDKTAVLDSRLRVLGIQRLRVVDASIMPIITNANTQAPTYGIAEKASDMILSDWESKYVSSY